MISERLFLTAYAKQEPADRFRAEPRFLTVSGDSEKCHAIVRNITGRTDEQRINRIAEGLETVYDSSIPVSVMCGRANSALRTIREDLTRTVLRSIIRLAYSLGMDVITEGVETEGQLDVLTEMGCKYFQGYLFSRPVPADIFERNSSNAES